MEPKKTLNNQNNLEKEEQSWKNLLPDVKPCYYKAIVFKTVWYWHTDTYINGA